MKMPVLRLFILFACVLVPTLTFSQNEEKPALVIGIVVDQMRYDYITRYWDLYGSDGFRKLVSEGYNFSNAHYSFVPTFTGAGHANISTGTVPSVNGIIGNEWYERAEQKTVYCAEDASVQTVGSTSVAGKMSPTRLLSTTVGDELRLASNFQSKVFGVALKDRGAILSTGTAANGAYWFDDNSGSFITSTYYLKELPEWVQQFNRQQLPKKYLNQVWKPVKPVEELRLVSTEDQSPFEGTYKGVSKPVFPYDLKEISKGKNTGLIRSVPFGNTLTFDFARGLITNEDLGKDRFTDILMISLSTPDYIGHQFGPRAVEVADMYIRLDQDIANFLKFLSANFPEKNYLLFLTADHAVADNPHFLKDKKLPGGSFDDSIIESLKESLKSKFGEDLILAYENLQLYLNYETLEAKKIDRKEVIKFCVEHLQKFESISKLIPADVLTYSTTTDPLIQKYARGFYPRRSGDIAIVLDPGYVVIGKSMTGTTHGSGYSYDTHVPIVWWGMDVKQGASTEQVSVSDIAPTLSSFLSIAFPNGNSGRVLNIRK